MIDYCHYKNYYFRKIEDLDNYLSLNDMICYFNEKCINLDFDIE